MQLELGMFRTTKGFKSNHKATELVCENCESGFLANRKNARFCSSSCRSQFWLNKNSKKVITLAVPVDIDDVYLDKIKHMLLNYKKGDDVLFNKTKQVEAAKPFIKEYQPLNETRIFVDLKEMQMYLHRVGFEDYKIPKIDKGIYYDEGLTIKKIGAEYETHIHQKSA